MRMHRSKVNYQSIVAIASYMCCVCFGTFLIIHSLILTTVILNSNVNSSPVTNIMDEVQNQFSSSSILYTQITSASLQSHQKQNGQSRVLNKKQRGEQADGRIPDGTFNGGPMYLQRTDLSKIQSSVHCVGETYQSNTAFMDKSCHFTFLCYNISSHEYVVYENEFQRKMSKLFSLNPLIHASDILHRHNDSNSIAIGGINLRWGTTGISRLRWFPKIIPISVVDETVTNHKSSNNEYDNHNFLRARATELQYYELPSSTVLVPYHSLNGANPGHLIWDDFLPIYTLLSLFQLHDPTMYNILPIRSVLQDGEHGLWASCDVNENKTTACTHMIQKFWSLLVGLNSTYTYTTNLQPKITETKPNSSKLICAKHGVAGIGSLTDHGLYKTHGWEQNDYKHIHNHGRGNELYMFRNFMLSNMNINPYYDWTIHKPDHSQNNNNVVPEPYRIVFSIQSSSRNTQNVNFKNEIQKIQASVPNVIIEQHVMKNISLHDQLSISSRTTIYISICGGGAVSAMFVPKGGSIILYYFEDSGLTNGKPNHQPALLDFDLFNAMSHTRVHWLPYRSTRVVESNNNTTPTMDPLVLLIQHEIQYIESNYID